MGKFLHKFKAEEDFNEAYNGEGYIEPWVSYTDVPEMEDEEHVNYNKENIVVFSISGISIVGFSGPGIVDLEAEGYDRTFKYGVQKSVWPDGVKYRLEFPLPHDSSLEGPYMGTYSETFRIEDGRYVDVGFEGYYVAHEDASMYSGGPEGYWFFRVKFNGMQ